MFSSFIFIYMSLILSLQIMQPIDGIIFGVKASKKDWPSLVYVAYSSRLSCVGSLIMPNWVITAARCIDSNFIGGEKILLGIRLGVTDPDKAEGTFIPKDKVFKHEHYYMHASSGSTINDIGLIKLAKYTVFNDEIHAIGLGYDQPAEKITCITAGWGVNSIDVYTHMIKDSADLYNQPRDLRQIKQTVVNIWDCQSARADDVKYAIDEGWHTCARASFDQNDNLKGPSYGDNGAPLVCNGQQVAILAFTMYDPDIYPNHMAVYTTLNRYRKWIEETIKKDLEIDIKKNSEPPSSTQPQVDFWQDLNIGNFNKPSRILCFTILLVRNWNL